MLALHRYLTWTPSRLLGVSLTDAVGDRRGQNQPGTIDEYPNWRVPLSGPDGAPMLLEDVLASRRAAELLSVIGTDHSFVIGRSAIATVRGSRSCWRRGLGSAAARSAGLRTAR